MNGNYTSTTRGNLTVNGAFVYWENGDVTKTCELTDQCQPSKHEDFSLWTDEKRAKVKADSKPTEAKVEAEK